MLDGEITDFRYPTYSSSLLHCTAYASELFFLVWRTGIGYPAPAPTDCCRDRCHVGILKVDNRSIAGVAK
jgi:hypothetical protein